MSVLRKAIQPVLRKPLHGPFAAPYVSDPRAQVISALFGAGEQGALFDPSDLSTLYQDSAGTTPVTADGDPVGRMEDLSGNENHATQATSAFRPIYKTDGTLHWIQFDGVDDRLEFTNLSGTESTIAIASMLRSGTGYRVAVQFSKQIIYANLSTAGTWGGFNAAEVPSSYSMSSTKRIAIERSRSFNDVDLFTDGNAVETVTTGTSYSTRATSSISTGGSQSGAINCYGMAGNLTAVSDSAVGLLKSWLSEKSGVTL